MIDTTLNQLVARASDRFAHRYCREPQWIVAAPGRVNLIGEHIDYNAGFVLPMAIDRYCVIAAGDCPLFASQNITPNESVTREKGTVPFATVFSVATEEESRIPLRTSDEVPDRARGQWSNYVAGVIAGCAAHNLRPGGFNAVIDSTVPFGGGLSSSAAIEVATATLVEAMTGKNLDPVEKALLCQTAEHEYAGVPCGIMDQFASVLCRADHLMLLDCRSQAIEHIPFADPHVTVLIINTNVKHALTGGEYAERRAQCESAALKLGVDTLRDATGDQPESRRNELTTAEYRRARHAIGEIARTVEAAAAVKSGDWPRMGQLMYASHESLRDDFEVSCRELDLLVELAHDIGPAGGVIGSRMTGGGFGGCTVSLVETEKVDQVAQQIAHRYYEDTRIEPTILVSRPSRGAHIIRAA